MRAIRRARRPFRNVEQQALAVEAIKKNKVSLLQWSHKHAKGRDMHRDEYLRGHHQTTPRELPVTKASKRGVESAKAKSWLLRRPAETLERKQRRRANLAKLSRSRSQNRMQTVTRNSTSTESSAKKAVARRTAAVTPVAPSPPCDVYTGDRALGPRGESSSSRRGSRTEWNRFKSAQLNKAPADRIPPLKDMQPDDQGEPPYPKQLAGARPAKAT